jgi:RNA polymerase sigma-70 factor (ECF subfamily)
MVTDVPRTITFEEFFLAEFPRLVAMLTAWTGDRATAEDLAQDALVQAEQRWAHVSALDQPGSWVRRVALNRSSNEGRRRSRHARALQRSSGEPAGDRVEPIVDAHLWSIVRTLPLAQRQAIVLRYVDDLPLAAIAQVMGCAEGTVKTHLQRGRDTVRDRLAERLEEDSR